MTLSESSWISKAILPNNRLLVPYKYMPMFLLAAHPTAFLFGKTPAELSLALFSITVIATLFTRPKLATRALNSLRSKPTLLIILACLALSWLILILSSILSPHDRNYLDLALAYGRWPLFVAAILAFIAYSPIKRAIQWAAWGCLLASGFLAIDMIVQAVNGVDLLGFPAHSIYRMKGPLEEPNAGMYLTFFAPFGFIALKTSIKNNRPAFFACAAYLLVVVLAIFLSGERIFLIYSLLGATLTLVLWLKWRAILPLLLLSACFLVVALSSPAHLNRYVDRTINEVNSNIDQLMALDINPKGSYANHIIRGFQATVDRPVLGHGINGFRFYCDYRSIHHVGDETNRLSCTTHPHHTYLALSVAGGLPLLLVWAVLMGSFGGMIVRQLFSRTTQNKWQLGLLIWTFVPFASPLLISENFLVNSSELLFWYSFGIGLVVLSYRQRSAGLASDLGASASLGQSKP